MRIFMLGWEFPPFISGGLGTACYGLTRALSELGHHVMFVLPQAVTSETATHVQLKSPKDMAAAPFGTYTLSEFQNVIFKSIPSKVTGYGRFEPLTAQEISQMLGRALSPTEREVWERITANSQKSGGTAGQYGGDMVGEADRYAEIALALAKDEDFDVVHAHDWMTYPAGITVAAAMNKPLIVHVHSTEFDRSGEQVNQRIYDIERRGVHLSQKAIAVSHLTRNILVSRYAAPAGRVEVVYNAIDNNGEKTDVPPTIQRDEKIVLFLGRITMQKGPEYFLAAAKRVLEYEKNVRFVMAGSGDLTRKSIELARELGIADKVVFTGFLRGDDVARVFKLADLYVMPSVSEPFGIAPLEAMSHDVPVLISKQSGVSEVLTHVLKVDFWDVDEMANKIIAVLRHPPLQATLREHGNFEVRRLTWRDSAAHCIRVYEEAMSVFRAGRA